MAYVGHYVIRKKTILTIAINQLLHTAVKHVKDIFSKYTQKEAYWVYTLDSTEPESLTDDFSLASFLWITLVW